MPKASEQQLFLGRQPIFTPQNQVYGYELLFRGGREPNSAEFDNAEEATGTVLHNTLMGFGLNQIVGDRKAFINFSQSFFECQAIPFFSPDRIICEILENVRPTDKALSGMQRLKDQGFALALDDFVFKREFMPFLLLADYIKLDVINAPPEKIAPLTEKIRRVTQATLLAEKVENKAIYQACQEAGFALFQGYYFAKPEILVGKKLSIGKQNILALLASILDEKISLDALQTIIQRDVGLSHKLLTLAQQYRTERMPKFDSLKEVMQLFGLKRIQSWATMISLSLATDVVPEVFNMAQTRAIFMRKAAQHQFPAQTEAYFLAGLFSLLDNILGQPIAEALDNLHLSDVIQQAIIENSGEMGTTLKICCALERGKPEDINIEYKILYLEAVGEAMQTPL